MRLKVRRLSPTASLPRYAHQGDAGLDLCSVIDTEIHPGESQLIPTGLAVELPEGTEGQVRPRSGLAAEHMVTVLNAPGTIDEGYRGEVRVLLINHGRRVFQVSAGMRIAQLVVQRRCDLEVVEIDELSDTRRGAGGFGSTGS